MKTVYARLPENPNVTLKLRVFRQIEQLRDRFGVLGDRRYAAPQIGRARHRHGLGVRRQQVQELVARGFVFEVPTLCDADQAGDALGLERVHVRRADLVDLGRSVGDERGNAGQHCEGAAVHRHDVEVRLV